MATTWGEIKAITLTKLFVTGGSDSQEYMDAMPYVYNEAARLIATHNRYIQKLYVVETDGETDITVVDVAKDIPDAYQVQKIYLRKDGDWAEVKPINVVDGNWISLDNNVDGEYVIMYYAYPLKVTQNTDDEVELDIDDDVASIIPLYMASQLYKDDDNSIATVYRNEFEAARQELNRFRNGSYGDHFTSVTGWW